MGEVGGGERWFSSVHVGCCSFLPFVLENYSFATTLFRWCWNDGGGVEVGGHNFRCTWEIDADMRGWIRVRDSDGSYVLFPEIAR